MSLQQHHILECLAILREANGLAKLIDIVLDNSEQDKLGHRELILRRKIKKTLR